MTVLLKNNAQSFLAVAISASDVTLTLVSGGGAAFPVAGGSNYFYATLSTTAGSYEIVKCVALSGDILTVVRGQESTTAIAFAAGSRVELRVTAQAVIDAINDRVSAKDDASEIPYTPAGTGIVVTNVQNKLRQVVSAIDYGADNTGVADSTSAIQLALNQNNIVFLPAGRYRINGTLDMALGGIMHGATNSGDYFPGHPGKDGTLLFKDAASSAGPIVRMKECSGIHHLQFDHQKINGGTDGIIAMDPVSTTTYASIDNVAIMGHRTTDTTGVTSCIGIKFDGSATTARVQFANRVSNYHITNCDIGVFLGGLANANAFTNGISRECHVHYELKGNATHGCIENVFTGLVCYTIVTMSPLAICFKLTQYAALNAFIGYTTEAYGYEFFEGPTGNSLNIFLGASNENASWTSQMNLRYMAPENVKNFTKHYLTSKTTNDRNVVGTGAKYYEQFFIDGTMPEANNNAGTFQAADADSKVIFRFNDTFKFLNFKSFRCRLKVFAYAPFGLGMHMADVEFLYRVTDSGTPPYGGQLCVTDVVKKGGLITGLYFITGKTGNATMGVGIVCGTMGGAYQVVNIRCFLEYEVLDYATDSDFFDNYVGLKTKTTAAATADDVTDAISLLTVADTTV